MTERSVDALGSDIVKIQRAARFADTTNEEWGTRLKRLIEAQPGHSDAAVSNVRQVGTAAGGSNGTLLFDAVWTQDGAQCQKALVLRFLPVKGLFHHYSVEEQFRLQHALEVTDVPVPPQVWLDAAGEHLVRPGYVMEQVRGASTPMTWMTSGIVADASPADRRRMTEGYLGSLAKLHAVDWRALGLEWMERRAAGSRPIEREVNWYWDSLTWSGRDEYIATLAPIRDWLIAKEPEDQDVVICHGDANFGNYLYEGTEVSAVVDWEMSFLGTPECDLTFLQVSDTILQNDVSPPEGYPDYDERKSIYERLSGRKLRHLPYYELFTMYRMAVINVLAMNHFPAEVLDSFMPVLKRGPQLAVDRARELGIQLHDAAAGGEARAER